MSEELKRGKAVTDRRDLGEGGLHREERIRNVSQG
jgi:hypothetical protein